MANYQRVVGDCIITENGNTQVVAGAALFAQTLVTWVSTASTSWNTAANWSTGAVPTSNDNVVFDGTSTVNCTCDVAINVASLTVTSAYSGTLDFGNSTYAHTIGGDATFDGTGTIDLGDSTITLSGNLDAIDQTTWTYATSTVVMTGTDKALKNSGSSPGIPLYNLTADGDITIEDSGYPYTNVNNTFTVNESKTVRFPSFGNLNVGNAIVCNGTLTGTSGVHNNFVLGISNATITIGANGDWQLGIYSYAPLNTVTIDNTAGGEISGPLYIRCNTLSVVSGGNYSGGIVIGDISTGTLQFGTGAGQTVSVSSLHIQNDNASRALTVDNATNNPSFVITGDLTVTEANSVTWTKGTGGITLSGTSNQTLTLPASFTDRLEDITINKTGGRVDLAGNIYTDSLTFDDGDLDLNGYTIYSAGSVEVNGDTGARFWNGTDSDMSNGKIDIDSGTLTLTGSA